MPTRSSFDYAVVRVAPRVEREEFVNAGVIVFCLERKFLGAKTHVDEARLRALWPLADVDLVRSRMEAIVKICDGAKDGDARQHSGGDVESADHIFVKGAAYQIAATG